MIFTENDENFYRWDVVGEILCLHANIHIDSSHDRLAHTLALLPNTHKSTSDLISPILARYDFLKYSFFSMKDGPSSGHKRVNMAVSYDCRFEAAKSTKQL